MDIEFYSQLGELEKNVEAIEEKMQSLAVAYKNLKEQVVVLKADPQSPSVKLRGIRDTSKKKDEELLQAMYAMQLQKFIKQELYTPPNYDEYLYALKRLEYESGTINVAFVGSVGEDKASLINAIRGLRDEQPGAAPLRVYRTIRDMRCYKGCDNFYFYDVPVGGPLDGSPHLAPVFWNYFKTYYLYLMHAMIVVWHKAITAEDIESMASCIIASVPFFLVRIKCNEKMSSFRAKQKGSSERSSNSEDLRGKICEFRAEQSKYAKQRIQKAYLRAQQKIPSDYPFKERHFLLNSQSLCAYVIDKIEDANALDEKLFERKIYRDFVVHAELTGKFIGG